MVSWSYPNHFLRILTSIIIYIYTLYIYTHYIYIYIIYIYTLYIYIYTYTLYNTQLYTYIKPSVFSRSPLLVITHIFQCTCPLLRHQALCGLSACCVADPQLIASRCVAEAVAAGLKLSWSGSAAQSGVLCHYVLSGCYIDIYMKSIWQLYIQLYIYIVI